MVKLLKRGKKGDAEEAAPAMEMAAEAPSESPPPQPMSHEGSSSQAPVAQAPAAQEPASYEPPAVTEQASGHEPPQFDPDAIHGNGGGSRARGGLLGRLDVGEQTASERERIAAMEWEQVLAPAMDLMRASVPEAGTPEEAERILAQNQGEITPDPKGGAYVAGDAFDTDARVYYRLLRRDYEKTPRPSDKDRRGVSHHLHGVYGKLTGTKGW